MATFAPGAAKHLVTLAGHPPAAQHRGREGGSCRGWVLGELGSANAAWVLQAGTQARWEAAALPFHEPWADLGCVQPVSPCAGWGGDKHRRAR